MRRFHYLIFIAVLSACTPSVPDTAAARVSNVHERLLSWIYAAVESEGRALTGTPANVPDDTPVLAQNWRQAKVVLYLRPEGPETPDSAFLFPGAGAAETEISFRMLSPQPTRARLVCDGKARLGRGGGVRQTAAAGREMRFTLEATIAANPRLILGPEVNRCDLTWGEDRHLALVRESVARPDLARLDAREDTCATPDPARLDALETAFYAPRWLSQTCAEPPGRIGLLEGELEALNARLEALTGRRLANAALTSGDPDQKLDFSRAPKLDLIYLSYLFIRADYSGYLVMRALEHHARQGAVIRILVTDKLMRDKDRHLFEGFAARHPNVQLQYYAWRASGAVSPAALVNQIQRAQHVKVFATLARNSGRSRLIIGGRNVWDGFFFDRPIDLTDYPELRTYDENAAQGLTYYSTYRDFEVEMRSDALVRNVAAHLSTFWHRDVHTQVARPMAVDDPSRRSAARGGVRHYLSLPWADGEAQVDYFVDLIDATRREIIIVTPFIYPPEPILNAMLQARARGVRVVVVARINSTDPSGIFITALNRGFVQNWADQFETYEYVPGDQMMHTKLILIDGRLSVVTSSNLNRRSFLHDSENGLVFLDRDVTGRLRGLVDRYLETANRMRPRDELEPFDRLMNGLKPLWQYF